jgi:hypothetical protein
MTNPRSYLALLLAILSLAVPPAGAHATASVPATGAHVLLSVGPGLSELRVTGTTTYASWAPGVFADAAFSYEPSKGSCLHYRGDLHTLWIDSAYPWNGTTIGPDGAILSPESSACDPTTHVYELRVLCPASSCTLDLQITDDDYHDNAGALTVETIAGSI